MVPDSYASQACVARTTIQLCGRGMILAGSGMLLAVNKGWGLCLALAGMLILILAMGMVQERWLTRERHRLIAIALKRTVAVSSSRRSKKKGS